MSLAKINTLAGKLGYPKPIRAIINAAPLDTQLNIHGRLARDILLNGDIHTKCHSRIEKGVTLHGDIAINEYVKIGQGSELRGTIEVGRYTNLVRNNWVRGDISLGRYCAIGPETAIQGTNHDLLQVGVQQRWQRELVNKDVPPEIDPIIIGNDVWIGRDAILLPGIEIGDGACIGAGSIVTQDVEPFAIVAGVPASRIDWRFDTETRATLLDMAWWEWSLEELRQRFDEVYAIIRDAEG